MLPPASHSDLPPSRLHSLDAWRGICAVVVFLSHWHPWSDFPPVGQVERFIREMGAQANSAFMTLFWPIGGHHPAVIAFFVLSGFCIHYPFERRAMLGQPSMTWPVYFKRRFFRIMPVYWAGCALGLVFVAAQTYAPARSALLDLHAGCSLEDVVVRFTAIAGIYPREIFAGNYILTTVTVEILMYVAYPIIHYHAMRGRWRGLALTFVALHLFAILLLRWFTPYWVFNSVFMFGIFWFSGAYAAHLHLAGRNRARAWWPLAAYVLFLVVKSLPYFYGLNLLKQAACALVAYLGILWVVRREHDTTAAPLSGRRGAFVRWVADISYSLYALHTPAVMLASWALLHLGLAHYSLQVVATLAASAAAVLGTHYIIERRFYRPTG